MHICLQTSSFLNVKTGCSLVSLFCSINLPEKVHDLKRPAEGVFTSQWAQIEKLGCSENYNFNIVNPMEVLL